MTIAAVLGLVDAGPGSLSLDGVLGQEHTGPAWTLAALAGGVLGAAAVDALASREAEPEGPRTERPGVRRRRREPGRRVGAAARARLSRVGVPA